MLRIDRMDRAGTVTLTLEGELTAEWVQVVAEECQRVLDAGKALRLDLAAVTYISHAGAEALQALFGGKVEILGASPLIEDLLRR